jgi:hypothetical protein
VNGEVTALAVSGTNLYAGGWFQSAGAVGANYIASWNGSAWSALGAAGVVSGPVAALVMSGTNLYAGGSFTGGGMELGYMVGWNGRAWSSLGSGMSSPVNALAVSGTNLYAGGYFTTAGGVTAQLIADWNGSTWSALGSGCSGFSVDALAVSGSTLYAGGNFTQAGGITANYIAKWDGSVWSPLGSGMNAPVGALAVSGNILYAGGAFTNAGGVSANYIAKWDGSAWSALGSGMGGGFSPSVNALVVTGNFLYAGGRFTNAGGATAYYIAAWNGSAWSALGSGVSDANYNAPYVSALAVGGTNLYAGGLFGAAGGVTANNIAVWNGSAWSALGSGAGEYSSAILNAVSALSADGAGHLYIGGSFSLAGTNVSPFIAQANIGPGVSGGILGSLAYSANKGFSFMLSNATIGQPYRIQASPSLATGSWTNFTNFTYVSPILISDPSAIVGPTKFYRAVSP